MKNKNLLVYKLWVISELESWAETFNNSYPEIMIEENKHENETYEFIHNLIYKFSNNKCTKQDYEDILFHIWQSKMES